MSDRMDFSPLELHDIRHEQLVGAVVSAARPELLRRAASDISPFAVLSGWARPSLAAAAILAAVCMSMLFRQDLETTPGSGIADALAVPTPAVAWLVGDRSPTVADLMVAMEEGN
jgi:hypothetical protein